MQNDVGLVQVSLTEEPMRCTLHTLQCEGLPTRRGILGEDGGKKSVARREFDMANDETLPDMKTTTWLHKTRAVNTAE